MWHEHLSEQLNGDMIIYHISSIPGGHLSKINAYFHEYCFDWQAPIKKKTSGCFDFDNSLTSVRAIKK